MMKIFLLFLITFAFSNKITTESYLDTNVAYIGDLLLWNIMVKSDSLNNINFPKLEIETDSMTVKNQGFYKNNETIYGTYFHIIAWDTGKFSTPVYHIELLNKNNIIKSKLKVEDLSFKIKSILDESKIDDFRPIKGPVPVNDIIKIKLIFLLTTFLIISYLLFKIFKNRQKYIYYKKTYIKKKNPKKIVLDRLENLKSNGLVKDFYTELSHLSRQYVEDMYFLRTLEMTTIQIKDNRRLFDFNDEDFLFWVSFLDKADSVKYSKNIFSIQEMENDKKDITAWIEKN